MTTPHVDGFEEEPEWIIELSRRGEPDPHAVYVRTYDGIAGAPARRRRRAPRRLVVAGVLLVAGALAALAVQTALSPNAVDWLRVARLVRPVAEPARPLPTPRHAYAPDLIGVVPVRPKAVVRIGESASFAVTALGPDLRYSWSVDGAPAGVGPRWIYTPDVRDVGRRRVELVVSGREETERRSWLVRVRPPHPPTVATEPAPGAVRVASAGALRLRVEPGPVVPGDRVRTVWQVDGAPAGEGNALTFHAARPGPALVRAVIRTDSGATTTREWRVDVSAPPPEPLRPVLAETNPPAPARPESPTRVVSAPAETPEPHPAARDAEAPRALARAVLPTRPVGATREEEVRRWLDRYAAAWRAHDLDALRRMGQVTSDRDADALRNYFGSVRDLDVEVDVVAVRIDGDRTTVRFMRRDRFRDPAGRLIEKESPLLEKTVVRTPDGFRFARPTG